MYIGVDFLIQDDGQLYVSEVNIGVPAGAQEYDFVHQVKHGRPSGIFERIEKISTQAFHKNFRAHIHHLPYLNDLRTLKIWMDGQGPPPVKPHPALRWEDKWIQYRMLKQEYPMIPTEIFTPEHAAEYENTLRCEGALVLKRRLSRGGRGLKVIKDITEIKESALPAGTHLIQPFIASGIGSYSLSIRAAAFAGRFICMFASLAQRSTSNHGIRFWVSPGDGPCIRPEKFTVRSFVQKAWEADIFYEGKIPDYLYHDVTHEDVAEAELFIPADAISEIRTLSASLSALYGALDAASLPKFFLEKPVEPQMPEGSPD